MVAIIMVTIYCYFAKENGKLHMNNYEKYQRITVLALK